MKKVEYEVVGWAKNENIVFPMVHRPTKAMRRALVKDLREGMNVLATDEYYAILNNGMQIHISQDMIDGLGEDVWAYGFDAVRKYGQFNPFHSGGEELAQTRRECCSVLVSKNGMASLKSAFSKGIRTEIMPATKEKEVLKHKNFWFEVDVDSLYYWDEEDRIELKVKGVKRVCLCDANVLAGTRFEGMNLVEVLSFLNENYSVSKDVSIKAEDEVILVDFEDEYENVVFVSPALREMSWGQKKYLGEIEKLIDFCMDSVCEDLLYKKRVSEEYIVCDFDESDYGNLYEHYKKILHLSRCRYGERSGYYETNGYLEQFADCCWHLGKIDEAFACYSELIKYLPAYRVEMAGIEYYAVLYKLGLCYEEMNKQEEANKCFEQVRVWLKKMSIKEDCFNTWNVCDHYDKWHEMEMYYHDQQERGEAYRDNGEYDKAIKCFKTAYDGFELLSLVQHARDVLCDMAWCYNLLGEPRRAIELYDVVLRLVDNTKPLRETRSHKEKETLLAPYVLDVAICYQNYGDSDTAFKLFCEVRAALEKYEGDEIILGWSYFGIAQIYYEREQWEKVILYAEKALRTFAKQHPDDDVLLDIISVHELLAETFFKQGEYLQAIENNLEVIALCKKQPNEEIYNEDIIEAYENLARCYEEQGDPESAKEYAKKALGLKSDNN